MKAWSQDLDQKFAQLTSGPDDITGASQLQEVNNVYIHISNHQVKLLHCLTNNIYNSLFNLPGLPTKFQRTNSPHRRQTNCRGNEGENGSNIQ